MAHIYLIQSIYAISNSKSTLLTSVSHFPMDQIEFGRLRHHDSLMLFGRLPIWVSYPSFIYNDNKLCAYSCSLYICNFVILLTVKHELSVSLIILPQNSSVSESSIQYRCLYLMLICCLKKVNNNQNIVNSWIIVIHVNFKDEKISKRKFMTSMHPLHSNSGRFAALAFVCSQ